MLKRAGLLLCGLALLALPAFAKDDFPPLTGRVVDAAHIIDAPTIQKLEGVLARHEATTDGEQIVVATIPDLGGNDIADYGYRLGRAWGIGQKGKNNGALLIVAPNSRDVRIEVGYGLEGVLTDAASSLIIQNVIVPRFRAGDMSGGILAGTQAILATLGDKDAGPLPKELTQATGDISPWGLLVILVIFLLMVRLFGLGNLLSFLAGMALGRSGRGGGNDGDGGGFSGGGGSFGGGGSSGKW